MPRVWCSISGHGFGHGAQTIPILNELGKRLHDLHILLRTKLPPHLFEDQLHPSWEIHPSIQDLGCVQDGPLIIDVEKTWSEHERFHQDWERAVQAEAELIRSHQPDLVVSNISYFGIEAGACSGIPTVGMGSLSWDQVLQFFLTQLSDEQKKTIHHIRRAYGNAQLMIRFAPKVPMAAFHDLVDVGPIAGPPLPSSGVVRDLLSMDSHEKLVVVAFGGISLSSWPIKALEKVRGYRFLIGEPLNIDGGSHISSTTALPVPFRQILAEADLILTKPGYATTIEAVRNATPIVFVRRYNFVDEQVLVDYAGRYGRSVELPIKQFDTGEWLEALETVQRLPLPTESPPELGTSAAAEVLAKFL